MVHYKFLTILLINATEMLFQRISRLKNNHYTKNRSIFDLEMKTSKINKKHHIYFFGLALPGINLLYYLDKI